MGGIRDRTTASTSEYQLRNRSDLERPHVWNADHWRAWYRLAYELLVVHSVPRPSPNQNMQSRWLSIRVLL